MRYRISGRPDRIVRTEWGFGPVDVKYSRCPPSGPHANHLAQVAVYCLLVEEHFGSRVHEAILEYIDGSFVVPFDDRLRSWILTVIREVQELKYSGEVPGRSHNQPAKCRVCGFRHGCREAL
jgi:CRISPR-associated exonuclease Cas4